MDPIRTSDITWLLDGEFANSVLIKMSTLNILLCDGREWVPFSTWLTDEVRKYKQLSMKGNYSVLNSNKNRVIRDTWCRDGGFDVSLMINISAVWWSNEILFDYCSFSSTSLLGEQQFRRRSLLPIPLLTFLRALLTRCLRLGLTVK